MNTAPDPTTAESISFPRAVLRLLAIFCLAYALFRLLNYIVIFAEERSLYPSFYPYSGINRIIYRALAVTNLLTLLAECTAGGALLAWKRWGRPVLIAALICDIVFVLVGTVYSFIAYATFVSAQRAASQPVQSALGIVAWSFFTNSVEHCAFPLLALCILRLRAISQFWASEAVGGFEVVPLAREADVDRG